MKNTTYILILILLIVASCKKEEQNKCMNGGYTVFDDCICPEGYRGTECETELRSYFYGMYRGTIYWSPPDKDTTTLVLEPHPNNDPRFLQIFRLVGNDKIYLTDVGATSPSQLRVAYPYGNSDSLIIVGSVSGIENTLYFNMYRKTAQGSNIVIYSFSGARL